MKTKLGKKGAALMQVLLITVILAGIATMLLRMGLSRTTSARRTRRLVNTQMLIESCMAEMNMVWASKTPEAFTRDLGGITDGPYSICKQVNSDGSCKSVDNGGTTGWGKFYSCAPVKVKQPDGTEVEYRVIAYFRADGSQYGTSFTMNYEVVGGNQNL